MVKASAVEGVEKKELLLLIKEWKYRKQRKQKTSDLERKQFSARASNFYITTWKREKGPFENGNDIHRVYFLHSRGRDRGRKKYSLNWLTKDLNGLIACPIK